MRQVDEVPRVGRSVVDGGQGDHRLELVEFLLRQHVDLLQTDQHVPCQLQSVVLVQYRVVGLHVEVFPQLRWQQMGEERTLVRALFTDEHQYHVVHHVSSTSRGEHAHEPFLEVLVEAFLFLVAQSLVAQIVGLWISLGGLDVHMTGEFSDGVVHQVVRGKGVGEELLDGVVEWGEVRPQDIHHILQSSLPFRTHQSPQRVLLTVGHLMPFLTEFPVFSEVLGHVTIRALQPSAFILS